MNGAGRVLQLIGVASGLGGPDPGSARGPQALQAAGLAAHLRGGGVAAHWAQVLTPAGGAAGQPAARRIAGVCARLAGRVRGCVAAGQRYAVVGGDHSCAIGTWSGAAAALAPVGPLGLIWIDAHMDAHTPASSPSGAVHGMPLAVLLGHVDPRLTAVGTAGGRLDPRRLCLVGVRSFEPAEAALLAALGVRCVLMEEVERRGLDAVLAEALAIAAAGSAGFGVSIDLDAVDPADAPGVATPVPGGIRGAVLLAALPGCAAASGLVGVEVAELDPDRDPSGRTTALALGLVAALLTGQEEDRNEHDHRA